MPPMAINRRSWSPSRNVNEPVEYTFKIRLNKTRAAASLNKVSPSTMVESLEGTGISLKMAIIETVSVFARTTPKSRAGIQLSPRLNFNRIAIIPEASTLPGPAKRAIGLNVLRRRLISVLMPASKIKIGRKRFKTREGSSPVRRGSKPVTANPANTKPVT